MTNWTRFCAIALGTLVGPLDSAVNIAFPAITGAFGMPQAAIQWVIVCYVILYATLLLIFGRLGDLFGHVRVFRIGLAICALAFLGSGLATSFEWLLTTRALQGVGTAMVLSCGPALTTGLFGEQQRTRALGAYAAVIGLGSAVGPSLGGLLVELWGWSAVFWFRLPIALASLALTFALEMPQQTRAAGRFDLAGATWLALAVGTVLAAISRARHGFSGVTEIAILAGLFGVAMVGISRQRGGGDAVVEFGMFRNIDLSLVTLVGIAVNLVGFAVMLFVPYYLARLSGLPVATGGLVLAISPIGMIIAGNIGPRLAGAIGAKQVALAGALMVTIGTGLIGLWGPREPLVSIAIASLVHGLGLGLFQVAQLDVSTAALARENRGVAGSLVMLSRTLGVVGAASGLTALFVHFESAASLGSDAGFLSAFQSTFRIAAGVLGAFMVLTLARPRLWFSRVGPPLS